MKTEHALLLGLAGAGAAAWLISSARRRALAYDFTGKTVVITGGSRGLGLVLARHFRAEGADVALIARDAEELDRARADLERRDGRGLVHTLAGDVTDQAQVTRLIERVTHDLGHVDVLVNNAGMIQVGPLETQTVADFEEAMRTHFWAPLYTSLAVLPEMRRRRDGRIVNISSIGGKIAIPHLVPYCASKFALVGLSEGMHAELARDNVIVTTVCPGLMRTGSPVNATFKGRHREEFTWFSLGDSLPLLSMSAESAATQIVNACRYGDAELTLSLPARLAAGLYPLFPGFSADLLGLVNRLLPSANGAGSIGTGRAKGSESESSLAPSLLTALSDRAAVENNEVMSS